LPGRSNRLLFLLGAIEDIGVSSRLIRLLGRHPSLFVKVPRPLFSVLQFSSVSLLVEVPLPLFPSPVLLFLSFIVFN
jgi:hypothetical protein